MTRTLLIALTLTFGSAASAGYISVNPSNGLRAPRQSLSQLLQSGRPLLNFGHPPASHQRGAGMTLSLGAPDGLHLELGLLPAGHLRITDGDLELLAFGD